MSFTSGFGSRRTLFWIMAVCLMVGACGQSNVPPTAAPTATGVATAAETPTDTPTAPAETPTAPAGAETATAPAQTPTPAPSATPAPSSSATPAPSASAGPTSIAGACTGTADHQAFFAEAASLEHFDVYCGALPARWYLQATAYQLPNGGQLTIQYKRVGGGQLDISEGAFCLTSPAACAPNVGVIGTANFGNLAGALDTYSSSPTVFVVYVAPGTTHAYSIRGTGVTQSEFVSLAAAMVKVPKS